MARRPRLTTLAQPRVLAVLGGAALLGLAWWGAPLAARQLAFFRVRRVEVVGATWIAPETIVAALQLRKNASVADPVEPLERRAFAVPGVAQVAITRRLPGVLVVTIEERTPVAYAPVDGILVPVDAHGRAMPYDARRTGAALPVLAAPDAKAAGVLARLRRVEPALYEMVTDGWIEGTDVVLATARGRLRFGTRSDSAMMRAVRLVGDRLAKDGQPWGELDGRFAGMVIRRKAGT